MVIGTTLLAFNFSSSISKSVISMIILTMTLLLISSILAIFSIYSNYFTFVCMGFIFIVFIFLIIYSSAYSCVTPNITQDPDIPVNVHQTYTTQIDKLRRQNENGKFDLPPNYDEVKDIYTISSNQPPSYIYATKYQLSSNSLEHQPSISKLDPKDTY